MLRSDGQWRYQRECHVISSVRECEDDGQSFEVEGRRRLTVDCVNKTHNPRPVDDTGIADD